MSNPIEAYPDEGSMCGDTTSSSHTEQTTVPVPLSATGTKYQLDPNMDIATSVVDAHSSAPMNSSTENISDQHIPPPEESHEKGQSMKHLTCYFWWENGHCKYSEEDCLYSHAETGRVAGPPTQVEPGGKPNR